MIMTQVQLDKDVAHYVLAYLARQGYKNTMSTFLQECTFLPPNTTMMVLPETPLSEIVAEYKAHKQSILMLGKLGPKASWDALWEKLEHYLSQLRMLADTLLGSHEYNMGRKRPCRTRTSQVQQFAVRQDHASNVNTSTGPVTTGTASQCFATSTSSSPRKSRNPVQLHLSAPPPNELQVASPDPSLAPRQLLDILLEDETLQHHLAGIINSSLLGDGGPDVMDRALDEILAMAAPEVGHDIHTDGQHQPNQQ